MKQVEFVVDNNKLSATLFFPQSLKAKNPAILFIQGWTGEKERSYQYANGLAELGFISFLFDARGHGDSGGNTNTATTKEFLDDVIAAYDYFIRVEGVNPENISVIGSSFGGYLATLLSTKRGVKRLVLRVPANYPNNAFDEPKMQTSGTDSPALFAWTAEKRGPVDTFALDAISRFNGDVLIIESEKDDVVHHQTVQNYADAVKDKSKLKHIVIKDAPHSFKKGPFRDKVEKILKEWFKKL